MAKRTYTTIVLDPDKEAVVLFEQPQPNLDTMQKAVGGLIEPVDFFLKQRVNQHVNAYCNEEFLYVDPRPNLVGTFVVQWNHMLMGPLFIYFTSKNTKAHEYMARIGVPGFEAYYKETV